MGCVRCLDKEAGTIQVRYLPRASTTPAYLAINNELLIGIFVYYIRGKEFELRSAFLEESYFSVLKAESHITLTSTEKLLTTFLIQPTIFVLVKS